MFEAVTRSSTDNPHIFGFGMMVQNKILVCRVLVLADAAFNQRRISKARKSKFYVSACRRQSLGGNLAFHSRGIHNRPSRIVGDFKTTPLISWNPIKPMPSRGTLKFTFTVVAPHGKLQIRESQIARSSSEEKYFLPGRRNCRRQECKDFPQPRPTREHVRIGIERFTRPKLNSLHMI